MKRFLTAVLAAIGCVAFGTHAEAKPLKVFILAGQSNMQGHAEIGTFDYLGDDPATAPILKEMRNADGTPRVCEHVWISSVGCLGDAYTDLTEKKGKLTAGFGAPDGKIGPEFTFGICAAKQLGEPILLIKTAWGGRSLHTDFRPPGAGAYPWSDYELAQRKMRGEDLEKIRAEKVAETGVYYRQMIAHVKKVLTDPKRVWPDYDAAQGVELAGFVWMQGFNDLVSDWTYDQQMKPGGYQLYADLLAQLIRDVRQDLSAPKLPVVIGVMGIDGVAADQKPPQMHFRQAQKAAAALPEFAGTVTAVETAAFWSEELGAIAAKRESVDQMSYFLDSKHKDYANADGTMTDAQKREYLKAFEARTITRAEAALWKRGASNAGYHYLGCAKTFALMGQAFAEAVLAMNPAAATVTHVEVQKGEMFGYLLYDGERLPNDYGAGFSFYAAAWPLVETYPGHDFQSGLVGTWMFPQYPPNQEPKEKHYTDIEGGLGWWRDTHFPTTTPKFIMGGVGDEFKWIANGPGYGAGSWEEPRGLYGVAQLSPWLLFPLDGLNLKQGTSGELFGYGYLPLPLTNPKTTTAGKNLPTGNQCWTLFLNTANFKGPATFFTPFFWSAALLDHPEWAGLLLDSVPADPNKAIQMETQHIPAVFAAATDGTKYARLAPTSFPVGPDGRSTLLHRHTVYKKAALWDDVQRWFDGGTPAGTTIKPAAAVVQTFKANGGSSWSFIPPQAPRDERFGLAWISFATSTTPDPMTLGALWNETLTTRNGSLVSLPGFYRLGTKDKTQEWSVVAAKEVPPELGLVAHRFQTPKEDPQEPRTTPEDPASCWKVPGPVAGPFKARLGDGSVVTYYWYRFADQPALLNADLTAEEREGVQKRVEKLHRAWTKDREYLAPPDSGKLAEIDPALIVTPPPGMEAGYVPIATRQELGQ